MKLYIDQLLYAILAGFAIGAFVFGVWLFATEPGVGAIAFVPCIAISIVAGLVWVVDQVLTLSIDLSGVNDGDRGQVESVPLLPTLVATVALSIYVGSLVVGQMTPRVTSETTLCAGGCGFWLPASDVAGVFAAVVIVLVVCIGVFGRAFMFADTSGGDDAD